MLNAQFSEPDLVTLSGGVRIGFFGARAPAATLTAKPGSLILRSVLFGSYTFLAEDVFALERVGSTAWFSRGFAIKHNLPDYPQKIIFWTRSDPDFLLKEIERVGFKPLGLPTELSKQPRSMPFRWQALVALYAIPYGLDYLVQGFPPNLAGKWKPSATDILSNVFFLAVFLLLGKIPALKNLVLKPGRSLDEIRLERRAFIIIFAILLIVFTFTKR